MNFDYCIYHRRCIDGISSAWIVKNYFPEIKMIECTAGENLEDIEQFFQKNLVILDVCPTDLLPVCKLAKNILIIDHHITTFELFQTEEYKSLKNTTLIYNETKAGCELTWEYFCQNENAPWFLGYIADRDLWKVTMPYSKEINSALYEGRHTQSFENLDKLYKLSGNLEELEKFKEELIKKGKIIVENRNALIIHSARTALRCRYRDYNIWVYTCPRHILSDVGSKLVRWQFKDGTFPAFVMTWNYDLERHEFGLSFRSAKNTVDVHIIARELSEKGGGHRNASGCVLPGGTELRTIFIPVDEDDQ